MKLTGNHISGYLALNISRLYHADIDLNLFFERSFTREFEFKVVLDHIIRNPEPQFVRIKDFTIPLFFYHSKEKEKISDFTLEEIAVNAFLLLSGWQEIVINERDMHGRFPFKESLQAKFSFQFVPVVNVLFEEICHRINKEGYICSPKKFSKSGSNIIFSHDIDRIYSGWYEATGNLLRKPGLARLSKWMRISYAKVFNNEDDYQKGFVRLLDLLKISDVKSVFFFLANKSADDADYNLTDTFIRKIFLELLNAGHLPGIHLGFDTFQSPDLMKAQIAHVENAFEAKIERNRQHFLKFDMNSTPEYLLSAGIRYDYSLGFAESPGFRNSIATPFFPLNFKTNEAFHLVEIPLFFMDGTYSHYQKDERARMTNPLEVLSEYADSVNFNFSVLFHNSVFTDFKYEGFTGLFEEMVSWCRKNDFSTDAQVIWPVTD